MATLYAAIANGGKLWLPQLVERVESPDGKVLEEFAPRVRRELAVSPETLAIVRQALVGVVNESKGTAYKARPEGHRGRGQDRHRAGAAAGAAEGGYEFGDARLVRRLRARGAADASRWPCWSSTAATAATSRRRWPWRSSTTTSRTRRPLNARRRASGCCAVACRARRAARAAPAAAPARRRRRRPSGAGRAAADRRRRQRGGPAVNVIKAVGWRKLRFRFDWTLTISAAAVAGLGLVNLWSAVHERQSSLFSQQIRGWAWARRCSWASRRSTTATSPASATSMHGGGRRDADRRAAVRQDGGRRPALVRPGPVPPAAVGAGAAADHHRARQVPERFAGARGADLAPPGDPGADRGRAVLADRQAARLRHGVPAAADLLHDHDDRAPAAEDAGGHRGPGDDRGVPDLPAPAARVSAQAGRGVLQPQLGRARTRRGRR